MAQHLYGRSEDDAAVRSYDRGLVIVAGDSGIGKTSFLSSLAGERTEDDLVASPITLRAILGSLQGSLAEALGDCLHQYTVQNPETAQAVWATIKTAAARLVDATGRQAGSLLISRAYEFLESKLGKEASGAIRAVLKEVLRPASATYEDRLESLVLPDTAADIAAITREVAHHTKRRLVLLLDGGERLAPDDRSLLAELATSLQGIDTLVIVCVNSSTNEGADVVRMSEGRDAPCHRLVALQRTEIYEWLAARGVPETSWDAIVHASSGYPLFIEDAIRLVHGGTSLTKIKAPIRFESLLRASWDALEPGMQLIVTRLAGFADPPTDEFLREYLNYSYLELSTLRKRLVSTGVFISRADDDVWFHERRRKHIWEMLLTDGDRRAVSGEILAAIRSHTISSGVISAWISSAIPSVVRQALPSERDEYVDNLISLTDHELGLLWALLEVREPNGQRGVFCETSDVVRYATVRAGFRGDAVGAIERLANMQMVHMATNEHLSIICLITPDAFAQAALIGEIEQRFQVRPVPRFATSAFEAFIRPLLGHFKAATISLGAGSLANHRDAMRQLPDETHGTSSPTSALGVDISADGHPVTITALFDTQDDQRAARDRISERYSSSLASRSSLRGLTDLPPVRVRFGRYQELLASFELTRSTNSAADAEELLNLYRKAAECFSLFQRHISNEEASALGISRRLRYVLDSSQWPTSWTEYLVGGNGEREPDLIDWAGPRPSFFDPLLELRMRAQEMLDPSESILHATIHGGAEPSIVHPLRMAVERLAKHGREFNRGLPLVEIPLDESVLASRITDERALLAAISAELAEASIVTEPLSDTDSVVVVISEVDPGLELSRWHARTYRICDLKHQVAVRVLPAGTHIPTFRDPVSHLRTLGFDYDESAIAWVSGGSATSIVGRPLGFDDSDVRLTGR
ncbi:ATP-binding protein [Isoptericola dokdonensis]|uniref:ATP-binding protein n=1 Tax=Isoptericola dokdonensis TaxID=372663 RepID=UPI0018DAF970|nr:ATP-binding protein [Isoptericola dokdonensis]